MGGLGGAGAVLAAEVCAPLLLLCWLCCWPDDASDTSSGKHPKKPVVANESSGSRRRPHEHFGRRFGSSVVSLQLPSTSGSTKQSLSAHRSHEEIRARRRSQLEVNDDEDRYHSAPSVIHEVLHRRDWERSTKELYIPLRPENEAISPASPSESYKPEDHRQRGAYDTSGRASRTCKKHHTNIKCSKKKETDDDIKDDDATETFSFYIGENCSSTSVPETRNENDIEISVRERPKGPVSTECKVHKAKETKQSQNECIKSKDRMRLVPVEEFTVSRFETVSPEAADLDRSGAQHHGAYGRVALLAHDASPVPPPPSVEPLGYESDTSFLEEGAKPSAALAWSPAGQVYVRGRHASAGDVLAPTHRPQSGALSESDIDFELEACDEPPPPYHEVHLLPDRHETAI